jgi:predicted ArsR family transcriptional regulator
VEREQRASAVLADDTRFGIYRYIAERPGAEVTVLDIAEQFDLHPNVARMHLGKLEQAHFLASSQRRRQGGGRPAKLYRLADGVQTFTIPPRRYELLAELALDVAAATAPDETAAALCREAGQAEGRRFLAELGHAPGRPEELAEAVAAVADAQGLLPKVWLDADVLHVDVRNCIFRETGIKHPALACAMHRAYLQGIVQALSGVPNLHVDADGEPIRRGGDCCHLVCLLADQPAT